MKMTTRQINFRVSEATKRKLDEAINKIQGVFLVAGVEPIDKGDLFLAAAYKFLTSNASLLESVEWAKRKQKIDAVVSEVRAILKEACHV